MEKKKKNEQIRRANSFFQSCLSAGHCCYVLLWKDRQLKSRKSGQPEGFTLGHSKSKVHRVTHMWVIFTGAQYWWRWGRLARLILKHKVCNSQFIHRVVSVFEIGWIVRQKTPKKNPLVGNKSRRSSVLCFIYCSYLSLFLDEAGCCFTLSRCSQRPSLTLLFLHFIFLA